MTEDRKVQETGGTSLTVSLTRQLEQIDKQKGDDLKVAVVGDIVVLGDAEDIEEGIDMLEAISTITGD